MAQSETGNWFEVERSAATAATAARQAEEWSSLVDALRLLMEARDHLATAARNGRRVQILEDEESLAAALEPGRYLLRPPLVGRSAKDFFLLGRDNEIPMLVLCREPTTQLSRCPIVALGDGVTVRMHVEGQHVGGSMRPLINLVISPSAASTRPWRLFVSLMRCLCAYKPFLTTGLSILRRSMQPRRQ